MRILSRYIGKEYLGNLALGLLIFTFVLLLEHLFELAEVLINKGGSFWLTLELMALLLPSTLTITLPVSCLLAALLTYGRFSETNEITAIRASGIAAWNYVKIPLLIALVLTSFLLPFNSSWAPKAQGRFRTLFSEILSRNPLVRIEENTFSQMGAYYFHIRRKSRRGRQMYGITIYKTAADNPPLRIYAERGTAAVVKNRGISFMLERGHVAKVDPMKPTAWVTTAFNNYSLEIPFTGTVVASEKTLQELTYHDLKRRIEELKAKGMPYPVLSSQIHFRWALAVTPVLFVFLGIPLAIRVQRGGRSIGFGLSLLVVAIYYVLLMGGTGLAQRGAVPTVPAVWAANAVLGAAACFFSWRFLKK